MVYKMIVKNTNLKMCNLDSLTSKCILRHQKHYCMTFAAYIAMLISIIYRSLYCCMLTGIHRSMERVTSDFRRSCLASSSSVFIVAINTCNTLQWRRVRDTNSCERLITRSSGIRDK